VETKDAKQLWFRGVEVKLGSFEQGELVNGEVLWEVFNREVGRIVGHLIGLLGSL